MQKEISDPITAKAQRVRAAEARVIAAAEVLEDNVGTGYCDDPQHDGVDDVRAAVVALRKARSS